MQAYKKFINPLDDGRRKLDPSLHPEIKRKYDGGGYSWSSLAREYGVSKKLIGLIVNPLTKSKMIARNKEVWRDYADHYGKEAHTRAITKTRTKKRLMGLSFNPTPILPKEKVCVGCGIKFIGIKAKKYHNRQCFEKAWRYGRKSEYDNAKFKVNPLN